MTNGQHSPSQSELTGPACISADSESFGQLASSSLSRDGGHALAVHRIGTYPVGFGGCSDVWKATMVRDGKTTSLVALKILRLTGADATRLGKRLKREIGCWKLLSHDRIAPFYCLAYQSNGSPGIVLPWYQNGSADVYLRRNPGVNPMPIILEIAEGIEHLHDKGVVHGDLKGANVMVDDEGHAKLIDFGLSRLIDSKDDLTTSTTSSIRWCAPELLCPEDGRVTKASDVYAFASTALELLTGGVPYIKLTTKMAVYWKVVSGVNPRGFSNELPCTILSPDTLWRILESCWTEALLRPTISEVEQLVRQLYI